MKLLNSIFAKVIPTKDIRILELRREIKQIKQENKLLLKEIIKLKEKNKTPITLYDKNIEEVILSKLREAKKEVCIAVAWFSSENLISQLQRLKEKGVVIKVIISNQASNKEKSIFNACNILKIIQGGARTNIMHNKYCIIDDTVVIDGSYNWSKNAKKNIEHILVIRDEDVAKMFKDNFYRIFDNPRYYGNYTMYEVA